MIFVKIHYGLGNQLFQYALARRISVERKIPFKIDASFYSLSAGNDQQNRGYELSKFTVVERMATDKDLQRFKGPSLYRRLSGWFDRLRPYYLRSVVYEQQPSFDPNILRIRSGAYLHGYWQNEKYFNTIEDVLREDLRFKDEPDSVNKSILKKIRSTQSSVAIHIRRGDYLTDKTVISLLHPCPMAYYQAAIDHLVNVVGDPFFFIFSDDPEWVEANFKVEHPHFFVSGYNANQPVEELRLMSSCNHFIIANSSFSWWAAWLGKAQDKIVVAPKLWFRSGLNIACAGWIKL